MQRGAGPARLAVFPATVLTGDAEQQWLANAIPIVLQQDLATSVDFVPSLVPDSSGAYQLDSAQFLRSTVEQHNGRLRIQVIVTSVSTQQNAHVLVQEGRVSEGIIPLLNTLAKRLDPARATPFSTRNGEALKLFTGAVSAPDLGTRNQLLNASIAADPAFGLGQIARVENARQGVPLNAVPVDSFVPLDRARWAALFARLTHASIAQRASAEEAVVRLAPNNVEALSALGADRFLQGNAADGDHLLRRAISLNPSNQTLSLQLAQGLVAVRRFAEAEKILTNLAASSANFLPPLALVQLLGGDAKTADKTFQRFLSFLPAGSPAIASFQTQWQQFKTPDLQLAPAQTPEFWQSVVNQSGDTNLAARAMLAASLAKAGNPQAANQIQVLPFVPEMADPNAAVAFNEMRRRLRAGSK